MSHEKVSLNNKKHASSDASDIEDITWNEL